MKDESSFPFSLFPSSVYVYIVASYGVVFRAALGGERKNMVADGRQFTALRVFVRGRNRRVARIL